VGLFWNIKSGGDAALRRTETLLRDHFEGLVVTKYEGTVGQISKKLTPAAIEKIAGEVTRSSEAPLTADRVHRGLSTICLSSSVEVFHPLATRPKPSFMTHIEAPRLLVIAASLL